MTSVTKVPPPIGSFWIRREYEKHYFKITRIENYRVFCDMYHRQTHCRESSVILHLWGFYKNNTTFILDEI